MSLHHVGIEIAPEEVEATVGFFEMLGFERVQPPAGLERYTWLERQGTQIHLMPEEEPTVPTRAHLAIVVDDFEAALDRLRERGFASDRHREYWGAPRAFAEAPGGHRVELMAAAPDRGGDSDIFPTGVG